MSARPLVLVPGACLGGWAWREVAVRLRRFGHDVFPVTLTGLGERVHLASRDVDLETHIADVLGLLDYEDLRDAVLVGHSYAGVVVTGAADRRPERLNAVVYLDCSPLPAGTARHATRRRRARRRRLALAGPRPGHARPGTLRQHDRSGGPPLRSDRAARHPAALRDLYHAAATCPCATARCPARRDLLHRWRHHPRGHPDAARTRGSARRPIRRPRLGPTRARDRTLGDVLSARIRRRNAPCNRLATRDGAARPTMR